MPVPQVSQRLYVVVKNIPVNGYAIVPMELLCDYFPVNCILYEMRHVTQVTAVVDHLLCKVFHALILPLICVKH